MISTRVCATLLIGILFTLAGPTRADQCCPQAIEGVVPQDWPAGQVGSVAVPLTKEAPKDDQPAATVLAAEVHIEGRPQPLKTVAQIEPANRANKTPRRAWLMLKFDQADLGKSVTIKFAPAPPNETPLAYKCQFDAPMVQVKTPEDEMVLAYRHSEPDPSNKYPVIGFIHPLMGLDGEVITDSGPADHIHHRGLYWCWVRHEMNFKDAGEWWVPRHITLEPGKIECGQGPLFGRFVAEHNYITHVNDQNTPFIKETVVCRVFETTDTGRAVDIDIIMEALTDGVRIGGQPVQHKGYGGATIRYAPAAEVQMTADGRPNNPPGMNHLRAYWTDWNARFIGEDGQPREQRSGAAMLVHPSHPDYPPEWITRTYGVLNVSYPGLGMLEIPQDKPLRLRYRMWIHRGDAEQGQVGPQHDIYAADFDWNTQ